MCLKPKQKIPRKSFEDCAAIFYHYWAKIIISVNNVIFNYSLRNLFANGRLNFNLVKGSNKTFTQTQKVAQTDKQTHRLTSQLREWIGRVGHFSEKGNWFERWVCSLPLSILAVGWQPPSEWRTIRPQGAARIQHSRQGPRALVVCCVQCVVCSS